MFYRISISSKIGNHSKKNRLPRPLWDGKIRGTTQIAPTEKRLFRILNAEIRRGSPPQGSGPAKRILPAEIFQPWISSLPRTGLCLLPFVAIQMLTLSNTIDYNPFYGDCQSAFPL